MNGEAGYVQSATSVPPSVDSVCGLKMDATSIRWWRPKCDHGIRWWTA